MEIVARFARGEDIKITGRATGSARVDADDGVTPWHPYFWIDRLPCEETSRRARKNVGMLFDQPVPHQLVMLLVSHPLAVGTRCHDYRDWFLRLWSVDVCANYKSVVHRNGNVSFDHHRFSWIARRHLSLPRYEYISLD